MLIATMRTFKSAAFAFPNVKHIPAFTRKDGFMEIGVENGFHDYPAWLVTTVVPPCNEITKYRTELRYRT